MRTAKAKAHSNIALVKYWGKRPDVPRHLNLPAVGSLSMTLDALWTETSVGPWTSDVFELDGQTIEGKEATRVFEHLDQMWGAIHDAERPTARVQSVNHLPTAAGLASSASGFAALTLAAARAFEWDADRSTLSAWARRGSGSAARSVFGGFVRLDRGERPDGSDCVARPLLDAQAWPLRLVVAQTTREKKPIGSTEGMENSRQTSPYYGPWVETSEADLDAAAAALEARDLARLGEVMEHSTFKMHACMLATRPPILYWNGTTVSVIREVWKAREAGIAGYVTMDAGPHVKILCAASDAEALQARVAEVPGVEAVTVCAPGPDAQVEDVGGAR